MSRGSIPFAPTIFWFSNQYVTQRSRLRVLLHPADNMDNFGGDGFADPTGLEILTATLVA
jgi:hypothetical protein